MFSWCLCVLFAVIFYSGSAVSSCYGDDCSSDSGASAVMIVIIICAVIAKIMFWICCCHLRQRTRTVRIYRRLESGGSPVNVSARTAPMTSPVSESQRTRPEMNDSVQQGYCNPEHDSPPQTIPSIADERKPPPYDANEVPC